MLVIIMIILLFIHNVDVGFYRHFMQQQKEKQNSQYQRKIPVTEKKRAIQQK